MLHEVLLILSGHPSSLFDDHQLDDFQTITSAERSLLRSAEHLGYLHRELKTRFGIISKQHLSLICRAVATSIVTTHLSRFQQSILETERAILRKDASTVGAYNIVPLAGILKRFDGWKRRLEWYCELADLIMPKEHPPANKKNQILPSSCNGPIVMKSLRLSSNTGFPDIEAAALSLQQVAERVWMRLLSGWLLTGQISDQSESDFFIKTAESKSFGVPDFILDRNLIPSFVTDDAASTILFIGKLLNYLKVQNKTKPVVNAGDDGTGKVSSMLVNHMQLLSALDFPIRPATLSSAVNAIRKDFSNKLVEEMLPVHELLKILRGLKDFFLLGRIEFADTLLLQAHKYLNSRHQQLKGSTARAPGSPDLAGITMKQGELDTVLARTWTSMAQSSATDTEDEVLDWARDRLRFKLGSNIAQPETPQDQTARIVSAPSPFNDLLLSAPAMVTIDLDSTLSFFLSPSLLQCYSLLHTYFMALRRGQIQIRQLWRHQPLRKSGGRHQSSAKLQRNDQLNVIHSSRLIYMRRIWACSRHAHFVLSELGMYLSDEVVKKSWQCFEDWSTNAKQFSLTIAPHGKLVAVGNVGDFDLPPQHRALSVVDQLQNIDISEETQDIKDVEALSGAHQQYLEMCTTATLLHDDTYTRSLQHVLHLVDQFVGFIERLQKAQQGVDLGLQIADNLTQDRLMREEDTLKEETTKASQRLEEGLEKLLTRLRELSTMRMWSRDSGDGARFEPWESGGSLERLLLKLDFRSHDTE